MNRIVQKPLLGVLELGNVGQRYDKADHFAVRSDNRPRFQREPEIMTIGGAQPKVLIEPAPALLDDTVEHRAEPIAVKRMQHFQPARSRALERAALEPEQRLGF